MGGPEVTYDGVDLMQENKLIDYIVSGEGERTFKELLDCIVQNREPAQVKGLVWRSNGQVIYNGNRPPLVLDDIPFAYEDGFQDLKIKLFIMKLPGDVLSTVNIACLPLQEKYGSYL